MKHRQCVCSNGCALPAGDGELAAVVGTRCALLKEKAESSTGIFCYWRGNEPASVIEIKALISPLRASRRYQFGIISRRAGVI